LKEEFESTHHDKTLSPTKADEIRIRVGDVIPAIKDDYNINIIPSHPKREQRNFGSVEFSMK
jgi:hypothetical protein